MNKKFAPATLDTAFLPASECQAEPSSVVTAAIVHTTYCPLLAAPPTRIDLL